MSNIAKRRRGYGYEIEWTKRHFRRFGDQEIPAALCFNTCEDYIRFLEKSAEVEQFERDCLLIRRTFPELQEWCSSRPSVVVEYASKWGLLAVSGYCYFRELPVAVDTKFIERNKGILAELLPVRLLDQREQASAAVAATRPTGLRGVNAVDDVRQQLSDSMQQWLATLRTQNTRTAHFDEDFVLYVDGAKFGLTTHQSGSTRTRIVLAFHAALLEVSLARGGNHPGWLLFDAPNSTN